MYKMFAAFWDICIYAEVLIEVKVEKARQALVPTHCSQVSVYHWVQVWMVGDWMLSWQSGKNNGTILGRKDVLNLKFCLPPNFSCKLHIKIYWYIVLRGMKKHIVTMFEGNPPLPPYLKHLINIVVVYPVKSAALMQWQIYSVSLEAGERQDYLQSSAVCDCDGLCV